MSAREYKISLRDGSAQNVNATRQAEEGTFLIFYDGGGEVFRVPVKDVAIVSRADVPPPERPRIRTAAI